ncbi:hypothetical protein RF11_00811 [Thelohanellus kitauei]|uniref:Uncharacterized protein n=1 Tax=Thelohanellus kitauei TaxID=669202 RepID=A0A0C2MU14_THEKT|nr:hypothetical protein RF11_00811 [Thelohanellus kitauei]
MSQTCAPVNYLHALQNIHDTYCRQSDEYCQPLASTIERGFILADNCLINSLDIAQIRKMPKKVKDLLSNSITTISSDRSEHMEITISNGFRHGPLYSHLCKIERIGGNCLKLDSSTQGKNTIAPASGLNQISIFLERFSFYDNHIRNFCKHVEMRNNTKKCVPDPP